jgi:DNA helicase II / ATP-dependent DNA helicase PcrA
LAITASEILEPLNESQRQAVLHVDGPLLTLAGPGSGKTRVVTHRVAYLLDQGVSPYSILALTFTNKAAREMKHRIAKMVDDAPVWIGTFHGYCVRFLRRFGHSVGLSPNFTIFDTDDAKSAFKKALLEANVSTTHLNIGDLERRIGQLKNQAISPEAFEGMKRSHIDQIVAKVYPVYQKLLQQFNAVDFDDLLMHTANILRNTSELRADLDEKHRYVLVDEYQDTNIAQYLIVRGLSIDYPNINVTGDPDQSIYSWRGADISNILNFEKDYPNAVTVRLENNYRSTPQILSLADSLIACNTRRKSKILRPTRQEGPSVRFVHYRTDRDEADNIAQRIASEILENGAKGKDYAILYRTNSHSRLLEQALLRRKLNYQLIGGFRFYQREEIKDILGYLRLLHNPTDDISFERVVNVPNRGLGDVSMAKVRELAQSRQVPMLVALRAAVENGLLSKKAAAGAREFLVLYEELIPKCHAGLLDTIDHLLARSKYIEYITNRKTETPDESITGNINELRSDAMQIDADPESTENALERFLEQVTLNSDVDGMTDADNKVTLMTLHAAKGLEFKNVFVIAIEEGVLPHARSMENPMQLEEERRLFFVGITRAKDRLQLSMVKQRGFSNFRVSSPSPFLMELPRAEMEMVDMTDHQDYDTGLESESYDVDPFDDESSHRSKKSQRHSGDAKRPMPRGKVPFEYEEISQEVEIVSVKSSGRKTILLSDSTDGEIVDESPDETRENDLRVPTHNSFASPKLEDLQKRLPAMGLRTASSLSSIVNKEGVGVDQFETGSIVMHPDYGVGQVESIDGRGTRRVAKVSFENGKEASFQLSRSQLKLIEP